MSEKLQKILASDLFAHLHLLMTIHTVDLKNALCNIDPYPFKLHRDSSYTLTVGNTLQSGTAMPFRWEESISLPYASYKSMIDALLLEDEGK